MRERPSSSILWTARESGNQWFFRPRMKRTVQAAMAIAAINAVIDNEESGFRLRNTDSAARTIPVQLPKENTGTTPSGIWSFQARTKSTMIDEMT